MPRRVLLELASKRREASASVLFLCLEKQRDPELSWQMLDAMDPHLMKLLPLQRGMVKRRTREGLILNEPVRRFCPDKAEHMLREIEYTDFMADLAKLGYDTAKAEFIARACSYAQAQQSLSHYAR